MHATRNHDAADVTSDQDVTVVHHDWTTHHSLSTTIAEVIDSIATDDAVGQEPLHRHVDTEALDDLFRPRWGETSRLVGNLTFAVDEYEVTVYSTGIVMVSSAMDA